MKVLVEAQLPRRMAGWFSAAGCNALQHTRLAGWEPVYRRAGAIAAELDGRVVVSKDADFVNAHLLSGRPSQLLLVSTGNMAQLPLVLIPGYLVPLFLMLHLVALFQARRHALSGRSGEQD